MLLILLFVLFGVLFLVAEIVLLPGLSVGAVLALVCYGSAVYMAYRDYGVGVAIIVLCVVALLSVVAAYYSLRAKTWQRLALVKKVEGSVDSARSEHDVPVGARGVTLSRLSPMGRVVVDGRSYEAKLLSGYAEPQREVEVIGFDNSALIVKLVE